MATFREIGNDSTIIDAILADNPHLGTNRSMAIRLALHEWWDAAQPPRPASQEQETEAGQQRKGENDD